MLPDGIHDQLLARAILDMELVSANKIIISIILENET
jgi:hypothetical protein